MKWARDKAWLFVVMAPAALGALVGGQLPNPAYACECEPSWELVRGSEQTDDSEKHLERWPERAVLFDRGGWSGKRGHEKELGSLGPSDESTLHSLSTAYAP